MNFGLPEDHPFLDDLNDILIRWFKFTPDLVPADRIEIKGEIQQDFISGMVEVRIFGGDETIADQIFFHHYNLEGTIYIHLKPSFCAPFPIEEFIEETPFGRAARVIFDTETVSMEAMPIVYLWVNSSYAAGGFDAGICWEPCSARSLPDRRNDARGKE